MKTEEQKPRVVSTEAQETDPSAKPRIVKTEEQKPQKPMVEK